MRPRFRWELQAPSARIGPTTPTRARRPLRASVDPTDARNAPACTLQSAVNVAAGGWSRSLAAGDFNDDSEQVLAVANQSSANVDVLLNNSNSAAPKP